ncbi:MAG: phytanoyl-CoA dioxygenase family protein [Actinomycetota bacterium]|jgi:ectoine hydroxylase-related dioxygenase (phytanoyl-CoA dioxygenase family)|nr:phytanoyl-CoA dioxygenase family protein [Actinomycetota bacterium]
MGDGPAFDDRGLRALERDEIEAHVARIADQGFTVVPEAFTADVADTLAHELERLEHVLGTEPAGNAFEGLHTTRVYNLLGHGSAFEHIPVHPGVLPVCEAVLDPGLLVSSLSSIAIGPGEDAQPIHADDQVIPLPKPHPAVICNTMWAVTDFTEANGATRLVPGSHLAPDSPDLTRRYETVPAVMPRGSVLVWHGSLWHGGGANTTGERRIGIAMNYCAGYLRQQENQQLGLPVELVKLFEPRLRQLVGYDLYRGLIGHIDKRTPAQALLGDDRPTFMLWDAATPPST